MTAYHVTPFGERTMNEATQKRLEDFYAQYNRALVDLLGDEKFSWRSPAGGDGSGSREAAAAAQASR